MRASPSAFAALVLLAAPLGAWAQIDGAQCVDDTPPADPAHPSGQPSCAAAAQEGACPVDDPTLHYAVEVVSYLPDDNNEGTDVGPCDAGNFYCPNRCADPRATCQRFRGRNRCVVNLVGLLFRPVPRPRAAPAVILIPGSTPCTPTPGVRHTCSTTCGQDQGRFAPEPFCALKTYLLHRGFVVYVVYPRGYGDSFAQSTGLYVGNLVPQQVARGDGCTIGQVNPFATCSTFDLEDEGGLDIRHAVTRLKHTSYVDPDKIAVLGHSLGGIRTIALNNANAGIQAAVSISAASESWCVGGTVNTALETEMLADLDAAQHPIFLLAPRNDVNLTPLQEFSNELALNRHQHQSAIYPRVEDRNGKAYTEGDVAHYCFVNTTAGVDQYGPTVVDFLKRHGVTR